MSYLQQNIRWLHLSDFHVGQDNHGETMLFQSILNHIMKRIEADLCPDMIFITGDLAYSGSLNHYENFYQDFYMPLYEMLKSLNNSCEQRIFIVPGNHDVNRMKVKAVKTHGVLYEVKEFLDPTASGLAERKLLLPRFDAFIREDQTCRVGEKHWLTSEEGIYTRIFDVKGCEIGVVGINTAWLSSACEDRHNLSPGKSMLESGLNKISDARIKIVLGHHPIDWFLDSEVPAIRSLFSKYSVLYLHGHLHRNSVVQESVARENYLAIQSGAAFQAREDEIWINRFLWCTLDINGENIYIEPRLWSRQHQEWSLDGAAFPESQRIEGTDKWIFHIPRTTDDTNHPIRRDKTVLPVSARSIRQSLPPSWQLITEEFLTKLQIPLSDDQVLSFFDGRVPSWVEALSPLIPRRAIVSDLVKKIIEGERSGGLKVTLLKGAGGEGKSTILRQAISDIVNIDPKRHVLWQNGSDNTLPDLTNLLDDKSVWLVATDEGDQIAKVLFEAVKAYRAGIGPDVHFLLSCRDTDWIEVEADRLPWAQHVTFSELALRGLTIEDAYTIVQGWRKLGKPGMGKLYEKTDEEAAQDLFNAARSEYGHVDGAFLGAMLRMRIGEDLKSHVERLLQRLEKRDGPGGTLMNAFAYIAAPHSENMLHLSKIILARALRCEVKDIKRLVLGPLGQEAAVAQQGKFILTRHRAIAETAVEILSSKFHVDFDDIFLELAECVYDLYHENNLVSGLPEWLYLSKHFLQQNRHELAVQLARMAYIKEQDNEYLAVNYAKTLRDSSLLEQAVRVFREAPDSFNKDRTYYTEWGIAESCINNFGISIWLAGACLADNTDIKPVANKDAEYGLSVISNSALALFREYNDIEFLKLCSAACYIGLLLPSLRDRSREVFQQRIIESRLSDDSTWDTAAAFDQICYGINKAWQSREDDLPLSIPPGDELTFDKFKKLIGNIKISRDSILEL